MYLQNITKRFLKDNKELIEEDNWEEILIKASNLAQTDHFPIEELISLMKEVDRAKYYYSPYKVGDEVEFFNSYRFLTPEELSKLKLWTNNYKSKENLKKAKEDASTMEFHLYSKTGIILDIGYSKDNPFIYLVKINNNKILACPIQNIKSLIKN